MGRALSKLFRTVQQEGLQREWRDRQFHLKPSEQRVLGQKETAKRLARERFKQHMSWVLKRKARCGLQVIAIHFVLSEATPVDTDNAVQGLLRSAYSLK